MVAIVLVVFLIGYLAIVLEHPLKLDKTVPALAMGALCWAMVAAGFNQGWLEVIDTYGSVYGLGGIKDDAALDEQLHGFSDVLMHHLGKTAEILIFLIGAMTIVEIIDLHCGFDIIKSWITTRSKRKLLWITGVLAFVLSAIIDNLTATIVLVTLLNKLVPLRKERLWFIGLAVVAANAGGAWSPIGDVTTTMLWIAQKVTMDGLITNLHLPSLDCFLVPYLLVQFKSVFKGDIVAVQHDSQGGGRILSSRTMLFLGLGMIVFVPIFKTLTHLPPYIGMMLSLSVVWLVSEYIHPEENFDEERRHLYSAHTALSRIEFSSILFFLGILMAVAAIETVVVNGEGALKYAAMQLDNAIPNQNVVILLLGVGSAIIDNVPLVAASMGMYEMAIDDKLWHFIAYSAGTGGSMLIIGSAAGVAAMGMERIDFIWYLKNIAWLAAVGFLAGACVFLLMT